MAGLKGVFFDTSVIVAGLIDFGAGAEAAQSIMAEVSRRKDRPMTAWHCCLEFYAVATRLPEEFRLSPADATMLLEEEVFARFHIVELARLAQRGFFTSARDERVAGGRIYDAHIGAVAQGAKARVVVTDNLRHFRHLSGVEVLDSASFARRL